MRDFFTTRLALMAALVAVGPVAAQSKPQFEFKDVRAGFIPGPLAEKEDIARRMPMFKAGQWTPVYVTIEGKGALRDAVLTVQSVDSAEDLNDYPMPIPLVEFSAESPVHTFLTYTRPGKIETAISVRLQANGRDLCQAAEVNPYALQSNYYLYLMLGARLPGVRLPGMSEKEELRRSEIAAIDRVEELPDKWFGYNSADVVVLTTGDSGFIDGLLSDEVKRSALFEWVRRGGKLLLSVGKNQGLLANREPLKALLPVDLVGISTPKSLRVDFKTVSADDLADPLGKNLIDLTKFEKKPGRGVREVATYVDGNKNGPLIVQAPYGLGRVTVAAIDLDQPPFTRWKGQGAFWEQLLVESGPLYSSARADDYSGMVSLQEQNDIVSRLQRSLDSFDGVPIIPFYLVALFILVYIVIVGPLDYFFVKKIIKRPELTWVTFPLVVLVVSAASYFTAYALKGDAQQINKVDLIDIDEQTDTIQGTSWFSIFSPHIQNYTIGVEPADGWGVVKQDAAHGVSLPLVSWFARGDERGRHSLFRRSYEYDIEHGGLVRVPIQVWSTKGFQATWSGRFDPTQPPVRSGLFSTPADRSNLGGDVTSFLPANLEDAVLLHRGAVYNLGTLIPGAANAKKVTQSNDSTLNWARSNVVSAPTTYSPRGSYRSTNTVREPASQFMRELMFHEASRSGDTKRIYSNGMLREYDQSWRISGGEGKDPGEFAILVGKLAVAKGDAESVNAGQSSATRLWLGALPDGVAKRPSLEKQGTMRQETYVRVYLPVQPRK